MNELWFKDPQTLISSLDKVYEAAIRADKIKSVATVTVKKMMSFRGWSPKILTANLLEVVESLGVAYVPNDIVPGPAFLFPIPDVTGEPKRIVLRLCDETAYDTRHIDAGDKTKFIGPSWFGVEEATIARVIQSRAVLLVEGPFDLLAVRTMAPSFPVLCPLGKRITPGHLDYLRILCVEKVITLWDADAGGRSASSRDIKGFRTLNLSLGSRMNCKDPADALKTYESAYALRDLLLEATPRRPLYFEDD
jgi:hypothetical protein